ncbi:FAD-dependent thymidylate synthase [Leptospira bouyouniensis]|uniref:Flavin-dependent thymidylate synthase n=1 Tax=Leptospira bouyouniensis TaxID=2484911 RepID=A0ABY2LCF6_9LEPT|nr:FAD-dependent thymidylate synthase [Leptospira bouyouniensis]TGK53181.1 FAD-dependent thymidylate synthase [Leptospira bouyouniensis]
MQQSDFESISRVSVPELDSILGKPFPILDDGFVRLVDYMGSDESIVQAARVSYGKGTKKVNEDRGLIRYLMRHRHSTPFEMCELKLHVRVPMDTWRQWIRHRMANVNEYSTRYSVAIDSAQTTLPGEWRVQSVGNKQGSDGYLESTKGDHLTKRETEFQKFANDIYNERLEMGVAREQARKDLPLATYTEAYWKIDLHNLLHFLALRMDDHAQLEIRLFAKTIGEQIVKKWVPFAWEAFVDYRLSALNLTKYDTEIIAALNVSGKEGARKKAIELGMLDDQGTTAKKNREREELEYKLTKLGYSIPW